MSDTPERLEDIPLPDRSEAQKVAVLGSSLEEHALGVHWNMCENQLRYAVRGPDRPMTKRGLLSILQFRLQSTQFVSLFALHARLMASRLATPPR